MNGMKLITELVEDVQVLVEEKEGKKNLFIEGIFLQSGIKNRNGRIYPPQILEREAARYIGEKIKRGNSFGELGHPNGPGINLDRVSHITTDLRRDRNDWIGKARIIDEGHGKIARGIIEAGGNLGVSSRGMGSLKEENGAMIVQNDFHLAVAADIVADPSAPSAFVRGIMENVQWALNEMGEWVSQRLDDTKAELKTMSTQEIADKQTAIFEGFIQDLVENRSAEVLAKAAKVDVDLAKNALRRARIKARLTNRHGDQRFVWTAAREILGVDKK